MNNVINRKLIAVAISSAIASGGLITNAAAADINFSGYGSVRGGMLLDDNFSLPGLFPYTKDSMDFENESLFALQAAAKLNDKWSATIILQAKGSNEFDVEARWAYVNYKVSPETTLTAGRFALPFFKSSDTKDIGYAHNFARMPRSVYLDVDFSAIEGLRLSHSTYIGDGDISLKASYGSWDGDITVASGDTFEAKITDIFQVSVDYTYDWLSVFAGGFLGTWTTDLTEEYSAPFIGAGFDVNKQSGNISIDGASVYNLNKLNPIEDDIIYVSVGIGIDYEDILFNVEVAHFGIKDSVDTLDNSYYVSLGYRFGESVISLVSQGREAEDSADLDALKGISDPTINAIVSGIVTSSGLDVSDFTSNGIHYRYNASPNIAYKAEYTIIDSDFYNDDVGLVSVGVDFVF